MYSSNIKYLPQVDHLRAIAAIWIVLYHGEQLIRSFLENSKESSEIWHFTMNPLVAVIREGHSAVALFMVLSGFIFTYGAYGKTIAYKEFIFNRILRIYPLFLCLVFLSLAENPSAFDLASFVTTVLPLANIKVLATGTLIAMAWAISIEFQFYLIFPFLLRFLNTYKTKFFFSAIGCALLFRLLGASLGANVRDLSYWHLAGRIDQFIAGMAAAAVIHNFDLRPRNMRCLLVLIVVLIIGILFGFHRLGGWPDSGLWKVIWPTLEGSMYAVLVVSYIGSGTIISHALSRFLSGCGEVSFSIYLLHFPIIAAVIRHNILWRPTNSASLNAVLSTLWIVLPITVTSSILTYNSVEKPFLSLRKKYILRPQMTILVQ